MKTGTGTHPHSCPRGCGAPSPRQCRRRACPREDRDGNPPPLVSSRMRGPIPSSMPAQSLTPVKTGTGTHPHSCPRGRGDPSPRQCRRRAFPREDRDGNPPPLVSSRMRGPIPSSMPAQSLTPVKTGTGTHPHSCPRGRGDPSRRQCRRRAFPGEDRDGNPPPLVSSRMRGSIPSSMPAQSLPR